MNPDSSSIDLHTTGHNFLSDSFNTLNRIGHRNDVSNASYIARYDGDGLVLCIPEDVLLAPDGSWCYNFPIDITTDCDYLDLGMRVLDAINCVFRGHFVVNKQLAYRFLQERALSRGYGWVGPFECTITDWTSTLVRQMSLGETFGV